MLSFGDGGRSENARAIISCVMSFCVCSSVSLKERQKSDPNHAGAGQLPPL